MRSPKQFFAWILSLAFHLAAVGGLGWFIQHVRVPDGVARSAFVAIDLALVDTPVAAAAGAGDSGADTVASQLPTPRPETTPDPRAPQRPLLVSEPLLTTVEPSLITLPQPDPQAPVKPWRETHPDEKTTFAPDSDVATELDRSASTGTPGSGADSGSGFGSDTRQATARAVIHPVYPVGARRRGEEGRVVLELTVLPNGSTDDHTVVSSSGFFELDRAATSAIRRARFAPATRAGKPVASRIRLTFLFRLRD